MWLVRMRLITISKIISYAKDNPKSCLFTDKPDTRHLERAMELYDHSILPSKVMLTSTSSERQ